MQIDRRAILGVLGAAVAAPAAAQTETPPPAAPPAPPPLTARIAESALQNRHRLEHDGARFSGPAWDLLANEGAASEFFCVGEEHGIAENPKLAAQMFEHLRSAGYSKVAVEISPPMAAELDRAARDGVDGLQRLFANPEAYVAFFTMREEAEWIARARAAAPARGQMLWGLDYEVGADRRLIALLKAKRKPAAAVAALAALEQASAQSWARYNETHGPQFIYSFAGDPATVQAVRQAWPNADAEAQWILETLEETLAINQHWTRNEGYQSNERRARFNRSNLRRYLAAERTPPKVMFKFGASHMVRGLSHTQTFDLGTQIAELAQARGGKSFHLMVLPGAGTQHGQFDPTAWTYRPADAGAYDDMGMGPLLSAAYPDAFTLIDLRPIRALASGNRHKALEPDLVRNIHGFDALLVMSGSTASANL